MVNVCSVRKFSAVVCKLCEAVFEISRVTITDERALAVARCSTTVFLEVSTVAAEIYFSAEIERSSLSLETVSSSAAIERRTVHVLTVPSSAVTVKA